jgi:hypothetical protein
MSDEKQYEKTKEVVHFPGNQMQPRLERESFSLVPKDLGQAMELAKIIADSDLAPKDYKGKPGNVLIAVQMGAEVGLSPMAAIQSIAVINGKPSLYGDVGKAILLRNGFTIEELDTKKIKALGYASCTINRPGHPPCTRTFSIEDAKVAGLYQKAGPWSTYPERQMAWRAFWFAARDIGADVLKGLAGAEEVADLTERDITPASTEYQTGTQRLRSVVLPTPTLADVKIAIATATTPEQMFEAQEMAKKLTSESDREAANVTYRAWIAELRANSDKPAVVDNDSGKLTNDTGTVDKGTGEVIEHGKPASATTLKYSQIAHKLEKATDQDNLDASADLIQYCTGGADQVEELNKLYKKLRDGFREGDSK